MRRRSSRKHEPSHVRTDRDEAPTFAVVPVVVRIDGTRHRPALPTQPVVAREHRTRRLDAYLAHLAATHLPLPALAGLPDLVDRGAVAGEAGLDPADLTPPDGFLHHRLDETSSALGLATIHPAPPSTVVSIGELRGVVIAAAFEDAVARKQPKKKLVRTLEDVFDAIALRAGGRTAPAGPALEAMRRALAAGDVTGAATVDDVLCRAEAVLAARETSAGAIAPIDWRDFGRRLSAAIGHAGFSQSEVARLVGMSVGSLNRWVRSEKVPDARMEHLVTKIESVLGLASGALTRLLVRRRRGQGRLPGYLWPESHRGAENMRLRGKISKRLPDLAGLDDDAIRQAIVMTIDAYEIATKPGRRQREKRVRNQITHASQRFDADVRDWEKWATTADAGGATRLRDPIGAESVRAYRGFFRSIACFILSPGCPEALQRSPDDLRLAHIFAPTVLRAYFADRRSALQTDERENLAQIERLHSLQSALEFADGRVDLHAEIARLEDEHLPDRRDLSDREWIRAIGAAIEELRQTLRRSAKRPETVADRLEPILSLPRPLDVVDTIRAVQTAEQARLRVGSMAWALAFRNRLLIALLAQTALRSATIGQILVEGPDRHLSQVSGTWRLDMPAAMFKSDSEVVFEKGRYRRRLVEDGHLAPLLGDYLRDARPILLDHRESDFLFVTTKEGPVIGMAAPVVQQTVVDITRRAIGSAAPIEHRIVGIDHLTPHHFRGILATSVLKETGSTRIAADAIHCTEKTLIEHYGRWAPSDRADALQHALESVLYKSRAG